MFYDNFDISSIGTFWEKKDLPPNLVRTPIHQELVAEFSKNFMKTGRPKPLLIAGDRNVGKSTLINMVAERMHTAQWKVVRVSASDIIAGQRYVGDIEKSVRDFSVWLKDTPKSMWLAPNFHELLFMGSYDSKPSGILEQFLPYLEKGEIIVIGEIDSRMLEKLLQARPKLRDIFDIVEIEGSDRDFTVDLAEKWIKADPATWLWSECDASFIPETYNLAHQYLPHANNPGAVLNLLQFTRDLVKHEDRTTRITLAEVVDALSRTTGMPRVILDDRELLDIPALDKHFSGRVIGQQEAVKQIIERIAMIKAGLTDPSRPAGVFLFVGPTGTGKTEVAKSLADFLFGSEDRMIRLDMSEFQTADSLYRLLGDGRNMSEQFALVNNIRKKPFSVILLDEFEKAHNNIWDLFLQVFDDGRLTDQQGNVADFRHAIIIMTSNVGSSLPSSRAVGFKPVEGQYSEEQVLKSLEGTFRPEFLNRIDRIIAFNPLTESVVRQILRSELKKVLQRRGLRQKQWAIEWEDSAIDFLMEKGYSPTLGARPMKRAIEQYVLAPLALTIVQHQYPKGDQFLFISRKGQSLHVDFIDPDEPDVSWKERQQEVKKAARQKDQLSLEQIALHPHGSLAEYSFLNDRWQELNEEIKASEMAEEREDLMSDMSSPDFWDRDDRFPILADLEYLDRFREATDSVDSWRERLNPEGKERLHYPPELIGRIADRLRILSLSLKSWQEEAPQQAVMRLTLSEQQSTQGLDATDFMHYLVSMYEHWAKLRGVAIERHQHQQEDAQQYILVFRGLAAWSLLQDENGLHVLEEKVGQRQQKIAIRIDVLGLYPEQLRWQELRDWLGAFADLDVAHKVTRKYKRGKKKEIVDQVRGWRSSDWELIMKGNFDLLT